MYKGFITSTEEVDGDPSFVSNMKILQDTIDEMCIPPTPGFDTCLHVLAWEVALGTNVR